MILEDTVKVLNDQDELCNTALHLAAEAGHVDIVQKLVNIGSNKESRFKLKFLCTIYSEILCQIS